jgi:PqqA peptide cyclase
VHGRLGPALFECDPFRHGFAVPCGETVPGLHFPSVAEASLAAIWLQDLAFERFRGTAWMPDLCRSCERREIDWGCRCQAFVLTGDATRTDPACALSPDHALLAEACGEAANAGPDFVYRQYSGAARRTPEIIA